MELFRSIMDIVFIVACIGFLGVLVWTTLTIVKYIQTKSKQVQVKMDSEKFAEDNRNRTTEYSESMLDLVRNIVTQIAVLKFRTFQDTHRMNTEVDSESGWKVNRSHFEGLIKDIATTAAKSMNTANIDFDNLFFTKEFYENYIIETSVMQVKLMLDKTMGEMDEF